MTDIECKIYKILKDKNYHTAKAISNKLKISDRTCRTYIKELNSHISKYKLKISSKARYGYILEGNINSISEDFLNTCNKIPLNTTERIIYITEKLLGNSFIKLEDISEEIYTSTKTLSQDLKKVEENIKKYDLKLERKPYYGLKIVGNELKKRNLFIDIIEFKLNENKYNENYKINLKNISEIITTYLHKNEFKISDISLQNFIIAIFVTLIRNINNMLIDHIPIEKNDLFIEKKENIEKCMKYLLNHLSTKIKLTNEDLEYITLHFLTNETLTYKSIKKENIKEINELIKDIFYYVNLTFKIDLNNDKILFTNLYTHLIALTIRLRFGINIKNPLINDIKEKIPFEFNVASYVCNIISKKYSKKISDDEIGFIAVILSISNKFSEITHQKKNILIVCPSGRGIYKFLVHNYSIIFKDYFNIISSCGVKELQKKDLSDIDIVFSLVDINFKINKPIIKIKYFLDDEDIIKIKKIFKNENDLINNIFKKEYFTYIEEKKTKEEIIEIMSNKFKKNKFIPENIKDLIIEREKLGMTEICKYIAIPHPIIPLENINFIGVCILKHPIKWIENKVTLILFLCLDNLNNQNEEIYDILSKIINNQYILEKIKKVPTYANFTDTLKIL